MSLTREAAIKYATDALREFGLEEEARWIENPDAVRELLRHEPIVRIDYEEVGCADDSCGGGDPDSDYSAAHSRDCAVAAAWRALGDPRAAADIERAHRRAIDDTEHETRLVLQSKCAHATVVRRRSGAECPSCGKWFGSAQLDQVLAGKSPVNWGDTPAARMQTVSRALERQLITPEEARAILAT